MRQRRKQREWLGNAAMFAIGLLDMLTAFPATIYVHENAPQWEVPAVFVSLGLATLPALWYWRTRRFGWVVLIICSLFLSFSFGAAILHGWKEQAVVFYDGAAVVFSVIVFVGVARVTRRFESAIRTFGEDLRGDPLFRRDMLFLDDGERITVYPRRRRLALNCMLGAVLLAGIGCAFAFLRVDNLLLWIGLGLLAVLLSVGSLAMLYRLVIHRPSLMVGPDGILDSGSLIWSGVGLIRWDEILAVYPSTKSSGWIKQHFLDIMATDLPAIRKRLTLLKRLALRNTYSGMSQLLIMQAMLETPVDELAVQIDRYVETHAPSGWRDDAAEEEASLRGNDNIQA